MPYHEFRKYLDQRSTPVYPEYSIEDPSSIATSQEVENIFEDMAEIAIMFIPETAGVTVQSIKQEGDRRYRLTVVPLTSAMVQDILLTFKNTMAKRLNVTILDLRDLWQN